MKQTFLLKTGLSFFLLFILLNPVCVHAQWTHDAYITDFKVNDDNLNSYQTNSKIGVDSAGNFVIVWRDCRIRLGAQYPGQLYCQRYNKEGLALGSNVLITDDTIGVPHISVVPDGRFVLLWVRDFRGNGGLQYIEFYFQRFSKFGNALSQPTKVIDTSYLADATPAGLSLTSNPEGKFIICWSKGHTFNSFRKVYFQRYDSSGSRIGLPDSVNQANSRAEYPDIAMNNDGSYVIVWQDDREDTVLIRYQIYMQRYNPSGGKIGNNVKVSDAPSGSYYRGAPNVSTNGKSYTIITWTDPRTCGFGEVYYQLIDTNSLPIDVNRKANNSPCGNTGSNISVTMRNDKKFFIYWSDWNFAAREQTYGRRFDSSGNPIGPQYMVPSSSPANTIQRADDCKILGDRIYSTWTDNRNGGSVNYDIYCNVRGFQNPDTVLGIGNSKKTVENSNLYYAYPNPFNAITKIKYQISNDFHVKLTVYDITGKQIIILVNQNQKRGAYELIFDGANLSSGIYFIHLNTRTAQQEVLKIVLLK